MREADDGLSLRYLEVNGLEGIGAVSDSRRVVLTGGHYDGDGYGWGTRSGSHDGNVD